jgi:hypothetical protein
MIGGKATYAASTPSTMPTQATVRAETPTREAATVDALTAPAPFRPARPPAAGCGVSRPRARAG